MSCQQAAFIARCEAGKASRGKMPLLAKNKVSPGSLNPTACLLLTEVALPAREDTDQLLQGGSRMPPASECILDFPVCGGV